MRTAPTILTLLLVTLTTGAAIASPPTITPLQNDQLQRLTQFTLDAIQPNGLVRDALLFDPAASPFHPATPDAAGFALLSLCAADHLGYTTLAEARVIQILKAYQGLVPGVTPQRSANGHWIHFMNLTTGLYQPGWDAAYSPIGSALLVAGAQFAANHFIDNAEINALADALQASVDFDAAIHPALDGRIWLSVGPSGTGDASFGTVRPWNEYMLVASLALDQPGATRAPAVAQAWFFTPGLPKATFAGFETLTDSPGNFAPAFWVQQQHFFNADFTRTPAFEAYYHNHRQADRAYCTTNLGQPYRYGLTAGVSPSGYVADRIFNHTSVFSPSAVGGWGDMATLTQWIATQVPGSNPRYRYGMVRQSSLQPAWIPPDAALVDHLFLMFGIVEAIDPLFFKQRQSGQLDADADGIADAHDNCNQFNPDQADADMNGIGDACEAAPCPADLTTTGTTNGIPDGTVNGSDFTYYLSLFASSDPRADLTNTGTTNGLPDGTINGSDFTYFLSLFAAGCP